MLNNHYLTKTNKKASINQSIIGALLSLSGMSILIIGQVTIDQGGRLVYAGIPLNSILFLLVFVFLFTVDRGKALIKVFKYLSPLLIGLIALFNSDNIDYGSYKLFNLFISSLISSACFYYIIKTRGTTFLVRNILLILLVLLSLAVLYKIKNGFFDRDVNFLLNGPIVFSRLMGIAALISLFSYKGLRQIILTSIFLLAMLWTNSKGPILSLVVCLSVIYITYQDIGKKVKFIIYFLFTSLLIYLNFNELSQMQLFQRYFLISLGLDSQLNSSYSVRLEMIFESLKVIIHTIVFGVGLGDWSLVVAENDNLLYPHNLFLEVGIEIGWILGSIFLIPFVMFLKEKPSILYALALFFFISQQVSGDILDGRYIVTFSILTILTKKLSNNNG